MDLQSLLSEIELDVRELKFLLDNSSYVADYTSRRLLQRNIDQAKQHLAQMEEQLRQMPANVKSEPNPFVAEVEKHEAVIAEETEPDAAVAAEPEAKADAPVADTPVADEEKADEEKAESVATAEPIAKAETESETVNMVESVAEETIGPRTALGDKMRVAGELRKALSLNDTFRFSREFFGGDTEALGAFLGKIESLGSYNEASAALMAAAGEKADEAAIEEMQAIFRRYFDN